MHKSNCIINVSVKCAKRCNKLNLTAVRAVIIHHRTDREADAPALCHKLCFQFLCRMMCSIKLAEKTAQKRQARQNIFLNTGNVKIHIDVGNAVGLNIML